MGFCESKAAPPLGFSPEYIKKTQKKRAERQSKKDEDHVIKSVYTSICINEENGEETLPIDFWEIKQEWMYRVGCADYLLHDSFGGMGDLRPIKQDSEKCKAISEKYDNFIRNIIKTEFVRKRGFKFENDEVKW